jgi:hypothetical protein
MVRLLELIFNHRPPILLALPVGFPLPLKAQRSKLTLSFMGLKDWRIDVEGERGRKLTDRLRRGDSAVFFVCGSEYLKIAGAREIEAARMDS